MSQWGRKQYQSWPSCSSSRSFSCASASVPPCEGLGGALGVEPGEVEADELAVDPPAVHAAARSPTSVTAASERDGTVYARAEWCRAHG